MHRAVPTYIFNTAGNAATAGTAGTAVTAVTAANGNDFRARPLKHWRKQLSSSRITSSVNIGMPMDRPGGSVPLSNACADSGECFGAAQLEEKVIKNPSLCSSCNLIKPIIKISDTRYTDTKAYLQSRCTTYDQKLAYNPVPFITYISSAGQPIEPSDSPNGTQVRKTNNCYSVYNPLTHCNNTTIYKPNNSQFAQQGGVSSGSRISRLKYNTLNNNGSAYQSASGAVGVNTGLYQTEPSPSYYNKLKPQKVVFLYKDGTQSYCKPEYSMCSSE